MNAVHPGPLPAQPAAHVPADGRNGSQIVAQLRQGLQNRQNKRLALGALIVGGLFLLMHDWSGGRVESPVTGKWTAILTDGNQDWEMNWTVKSKGTYQVQTYAVETGRIAVLRNNALSLTPKEHARRVVQIRVKDQKTIYLNGPVVSPGDWTEWSFGGQAGGNGLTLVGTWKSAAKSPGLRGARVLEIDGQGNYKFQEVLQAEGQMRAKKGAFVMRSEFDNYGDEGKYQVASGKLALSSKRFKSLVFQRPR